MVQEINARMHAAEAQDQTVTQVLNSTQLELSNMKAQVAASPTVSSFSGLPKQGCEDPGTRSFWRSVVLRHRIRPLNIVFYRLCNTVYACRWSAGIRLSAKDYLRYTAPLKYMGRLARYHLRVKNVPTESFDSFSDALKTHFTNHNS